MPTIKRCSSGKIKGKRVFNWETLDFTDLKISGDCESCEIYPDPVLAGGLVYLGIEDVYEFKFEGEFKAYTAENVAGNRITPRFGINIENIINASAWHYIPGQVFGKNYEHLFITLQIGNHTYTTDKVTGYEAPVKWKCWGKFPIRLFADIREYGRYNSNGTLWGKTGLETGETVDTRGYQNAELDWYWWTPKGGFVNFEVNDTTYTLFENGDTKPIKVTTAGGYQEGFDGGGSLISEAWNNPEYQTRTLEFWHTGNPETGKGVRYRSEGRKQTITPAGSFSDARNFNLQSGRLQPKKTIKITSSLENVGGFQWEEETFTVTPFDGPNITGHPLNVSTHFPINTSQELTFKIPSQIELSGVEYLIYASCWLDTFTDLVIDNYHVNQANEVALGFALSPSELEKWGQDKNLWRVPLSLPGASKWKSFRIDSFSFKNIDDFSSLKWGGLAGTSVAITKNVLHVSGTGELTIVRTYPKEENAPFGDSRYMRFDISCQNETNFKLKTDNGKEYLFTVNAGRHFAVVDLLSPETASEPDYQSTKREAIENPGWGWGIELPVTFSLISDNPYSINSIDLVSYPEVPSIALSATHISRNDKRFFVREVEIGNNKYEEYVRRQYAYFPEGRLAYDLPSGTIRQEFGVYQEDKAVNQYTLQDLIYSTYAKEPNGIRLFKNLTPKNDYQFIGWNGTFIWYEPEAYFHNGKAAYFLEEGFKRVFGESIVEYAQYTVDRIKLGIGVSLDTTFKRVLGTGFCGITLKNDRVADSFLVSTLTGNPSTVSTYPGGVYLIPFEHANLSITGNYGLYYNYIGEPVVTNLSQGFIGKASIVKE